MTYYNDFTACSNVLWSITYLNAQMKIVLFTSLQGPVMVDKVRFTESYFKYNLAVRTSHLSICYPFSFHSLGMNERISPVGCQAVHLSALSLHHTSRGLICFAFCTFISSSFTTLELGIRRSWLQPCHFSCTLINSGVWFITPYASR